jgi:hypothetical protein
MSLYSERAFFDGDACQHCADRDEHQRLARVRRQSEVSLRTRQLMRRNDALIDLVCADLAGGRHV